MRFAYRRENFKAILSHYDQNGFVVLTDVDPQISGAFRAVIASITGLTDEQIKKAGHDASVAISAEVRAKLARPQTTPELQDLLVSVFGDLITQILGPIIHVSRDFHPQIKKGAHQHIVNGYSGDGLEVEAPYGFHQDFTAGRVLTSPNAIVCWVPLNTCSDNGLRLYPRSHSKGLLINRWLPYDVPGLERIGPYVDVTAQEGEVLIFNFLMLHCTLRTGQRTRISCDVRFLPFCGILDSQAQALRPQPLTWMLNRLQEELGQTLQAPLYEALAYLGEPVKWPAAVPHSPLYWARFIEGLIEHDSSRMVEAIKGLTNSEIGFDDAESYVKRLAQVQLKDKPYASIQASLSPEHRHRCVEILKQNASPVDW